MPRFVQFLESSGKKGIGLMTGGILSFSIGVIEHFRDASIAAPIFFIIGVGAMLAGSYFAWAEAKQKLDSANAKILELVRPADRPQISFARWGQVETEPDAPIFRYGFYLNNHGGVALQVFIDNFKIGDLSVTSDPLPEINARGGRFIPIWLEEKGPLTKYNIKEVLQTFWEKCLKEHKVTWGQPVEIPVSVTYRDFANLGYRSECYLKYRKGEIEFSAVVQTCLGPVKPTKLGVQLTEESNSSSVQR
jgi:hypothetical protein